MNAAEIAKARRETMRWMLLVVVHISRPRGINTAALLPIIKATYPDATHHEVRRELDYLKERELVSIAVDPLDNWFVSLLRYGIDVVEYTCPCDPGIARPTITQA
jgi:hypothetical protein